jgi:hypothetical protein
MKKQILFLSAFILALPLLLLSCGTGQESARMDDPNVMRTETEGDVTVTSQYLDYNALVSRFTTKNNPFSSYASGTLIVIDVAVQSQDGVELRISEAELSTAEGNRTSVPKEDVRTYWQQKIDKRYNQRGSGGVINWSQTVVDRVDETLLPENVSVSAGGNVQGFITFDPKNAENVGGRKGGTATMTLPVYGTDGNLLHEFTYQFTIS